MPYCNNCGAKIVDGAKFCHKCGSTILVEHKETDNQRRQEFAGNVIKCPACGSEIPSFTAICPSCGHEINSARVSSTMKDFTSQISQYDIAIAKSPDGPKKGWKSWGKLKKFGWVILNIYTLCIPLVIYLLLPCLGISGKSVLTAEEKAKVQFIKNYPVPNDRESILEMLLFIKAQISSLTSGKIDRNVSRWIHIWKNKADQLYERAEILFKNDKIANDAYESILVSEKKVKKSLFIRLIIVVALIVLFAVFMFFRGGYGEAIKKVNATFEWPASGIALQVPEPPTDKGKIEYNDDEQFWITVRGIDQNQYEAYIEDCKEKGFTVEGKKDSISYEAYNEEGYYLDLTHMSSSTELTIRVEAPEPMADIQWPKSEIAKRIPVPASSYGRFDWETDHGFSLDVGNTTKQDFSDYIDACIDAGFTVNYDRSDTYFEADDVEGYHVRISYNGNNIISIKAEKPEKEEE